VENSPEYERTKAQIERLRSYIQEFRGKYIHKPDESGLETKPDNAYQAMLDAGGFTSPEEESDDSYKHINPYYEQQQANRERKPRTWQDNDFKKYKDTTNTVYVKEFKEDPELIKAQIAQMKGGVAASQEEAWWELPKDLTLSVEDFANTKRDLERYIGENLVAKVGMIIIFIGLLIAYRLAVSQGLIPIPIRIMAGCGLAALVFWIAHYLAKQQNTFTSLLITAGTYLLYQTIYTGYHEYEMMSAPVAMLYCLCVAIINGIAAAIYNRRLLIFLSMAGGYIAPYLIYGWAMPDIPFYGYLAFITILFVLVSYLENWRFVLFGAFLMWTVDIFTFWIGNDISVYENALLLTSINVLFFLIFLASNVAYSIKHPKVYTPSQILMNLNMLISIGWGLYGFHHLQIAGGWYLIGTSVILVVYASLLYGEEKWIAIVDHISWWAIITLTWGIAWLLDTAFQNIGWLVESLVLLWLGVATKRNLFNLTSQIVLLLALSHIVLVWWFSYQAAPALIFNQAFFTTLLLALGCLPLSYMLNSFPPLERVGFLPAVSYQHLLESCTATLLYLSGLFELIFHDVTFFGSAAVRALWIGNYNMLYLLGFRLIVQRNALDYFRFSTGLLMSVVVLSYLAYGLPQMYSLRALYLQTNDFRPFAIHYINVALSVVTLVLLVKDIVNAPEYRTGYSFVLWVMCIMFVVHATVEMENTFVIIGKNGFDANHEILVDQIRLIGITTLWSIIAFGLIFLGMKYKIKEIRIIALVLLGVTLLKFLLYDFIWLDVITQIISFLFVGILLILVSKLYGKLKTWVVEGKIITDRDSLLSQSERENLVRKWWQEKMKK